MNQGHGFAIDMIPAQRIPVVHVLVDQVEQIQVLGEGAPHHELGVGQEMVVEGQLTSVRGCRKIAPQDCFTVSGVCNRRFPFQKGVFVDTWHPLRDETRWIRA
jgi:hypothetical protein